MREIGIIADLTIVAGYLNLLIRVPTALLLFTPAGTPRRVTRGLKLGGGVFFFTCALTHLSQAGHMWIMDAVGHDLSLASHVANMVVQAIAVWVFGFALPQFLTLIQESLTPTFGRRKEERGGS